MAFHDYFQAMCPAVTCVNSNKTLRTFSDGVQYINEDWGLQCLGADYPQVLQNNVTDVPGQFQAFVGGGFLKALIGDVMFPTPLWITRQDPMDGHWSSSVLNTKSLASGMSLTLASISMPSSQHSKPMRKCSRLARGVALTITTVQVV